MKNVKWPLQRIFNDQVTRSQKKEEMVNLSMEGFENIEVDKIAIIEHHKFFPTRRNLGQPKLRLHNFHTSDTQLYSV